MFEHERHLVAALHVARLQHGRHLRHRTPGSGVGGALATECPLASVHGCAALGVTSWRSDATWEAVVSPKNLSTYTCLAAPDAAEASVTSALSASRRSGPLVGAPAHMPCTRHTRATPVPRA